MIEVLWQFSLNLQSFKRRLKSVLVSKEVNFLSKKIFTLELLFTCNEVRFLVNIYFFTFLLLLYIGEVKKSKVILKAKLAMNRLARVCLAQSGCYLWINTAEIYV